MTRPLRTANMPHAERSAPRRCGMDSLRARVWWARASLALVVLAVGVLLVFAHPRGLSLVLLTRVAVVVMGAARLWVPPPRRGLRRPPPAPPAAAPGARPRSLPA